MNRKELVFTGCVIGCIAVVVLGFTFAWKHLCFDKMKSGEQVSVLMVGEGSQPSEHEIKVWFKGEKESIQPGIVIDILGITTNSVYEENFTTNSVLTYIIRNESREDIFILLEPPPVSLEWVEITTSNESYQLEYPIVVHGPAPQPVDAVFFSGFRAWRSSTSFSFLKGFSLIIPSPSPKDLPIEQEPGSSLTRDFANEHFVKGLLRVSCVLTYCVVGKNELKTQRLEKVIIVKSKDG